MRQTFVTLLKNGARSPLQQKSQPLLPPLQLYRRILRQHKFLPPMQRELGDQYVKAEFQAHKTTDNPLFIVGFLASWQDYLSMITNGEWKEGTLSTELVDKMSPEQVGQLYELMLESKRAGRGEAPEISS